MDDIESERDETVVFMPFYQLNDNERCINYACPIVLNVRQRCERQSLKFRPNRSNGIFRFNQFPKVSKVNPNQGPVVETVSRIYNTENNRRLQRPTEQVNETLPIRLLKIANDTQQRNEQNIVKTENQQLEQRTYKIEPLEVI
ncbi:unnamed protein product [Brachionus calyciflorus]|uniref:Uncharacterized protein n=1 Tax=Brachionus calyciflorus TaxID=104777 RepID=A0A814LI51_9BILA|nr:unnamed protein product [Brachionus calyciflorus]